MRNIGTIILLVVLPRTAWSQFDYGITAGGVLTELHAKISDDPHLTTSVEDVSRAAFSASLFYRERYSDFVDLGFDLALAHRSFNAKYGVGGLAGSTSSSVRAELDQLYFGVKPEVRMDAKRSAVVRFGVMAGFRIGGSAKGTYLNSGGYGNTLNHEADLIRDFGGDFRFAFGFGFRIPLGDRWAISIDPEATMAFSSMLNEGAGMRGTDMGLRIGLSRRSMDRALTELFKAPPPDPSGGPSW
jgi:hypothetical protein